MQRPEAGVDTWVNYYKPPANVSLSGHAAKHIDTIDPNGPQGSPPELNDLGLLLGDKHMETRLMRIHDARGREHEFNLDDNGFQFAKLDSDVTDFTNEDHVKSTYYPQVEGLVKRL